MNSREKWRLGTILVIMWTSFLSRSIQGFSLFPVVLWRQRRRSTNEISTSFLLRSQQRNEDTKRVVNHLIGSVIQRAQSTLVTFTSPLTNEQSRNKAAPDPSTNRTTTEVSTSNQVVAPHPSNVTAKTVQSMPKLMYRGNPAITNTALAHSLWSAILRPDIDTAIDATCGNGHDSLALARLLFPNHDDNTDHHRQDSLSRLFCIDLQQRACDNTQQILMKDYRHLIETDRIQVIHKSHSPLPIDRTIVDEQLLSVALVVYNLGWLPSNTETTKDHCITQMDTTLQSMVDAMLLLRIGGMISVVTYPKTNAQEDVAVRTFLECTALLSSNIETWQDFLQTRQQSKEFVEYYASTTDMTHIIELSMQRLIQDGDPSQTWRVSEHKKLGMDRAPILLTATRIK